MLVDRFPYAVLYRAEAEQILLVAVIHLHRRPGYWRRSWSGRTIPLRKSGRGYRGSGICSCVPPTASSSDSAAPSSITPGGDVRGSMRQACCLIQVRQGPGETPDARATR